MSNGKYRKRVSDGGFLPRLSPINYMAAGVILAFGLTGQFDLLAAFALLYSIGLLAMAAVNRVSRA